MLASSDRISVVTLVKGEHRIRLALRLSHEYSGGEIVRFAPDAVVSVQGADEPSTHYTISNWISGVASGALYSFRTLRVRRQCIQVTEFVARLRTTDMDAVANAGALAIANLVGKELPNLPTDTWEIDIRTESATESRTSATPNAMCSGEDAHGVQAAVIEGANRSSTIRRGEDLHSMTTSELLLLVLADKIDRSLSVGDIRLIQDIAAKRTEAGDIQADDVIAEVKAYLS